MNSKIRRQFFRNVGTGWISTVVVGLAGFIIIPLNLRFLGKDVYGISVLAASLLTILSMISFGLNTTFQRFFSEAIARKDVDRFRTLSSTSQLLMLLIGLIGAGMFVAAFPYFVHAYNIETGLRSDVFYLFLVLAFSLFERLFVLPFTAMIQGTHRFDFVNLVQMFSVIIRLAALYIGYKLFVPSLRIMAIAFLLEAIFRLSAIILKGYKLHSEKIIFRRRYVQWSILPTLYSFGLYAFLTVFTLSLSLQIPVFIIGKTLGLDKVAVYGPAMTLGAVLASILSYVSTPLIPLATEYKVKNNEEGLQSMSMLMGEIVACGVGCIIAGLVLIGKDFVSVWLGPDFVWSSPIVIVTASATVFTSIQYVNYNIAVGASSIRTFAFSGIAMLLLLVVGVYCGTRFLGWNLLRTTVYIALIRILRDVLYLGLSSARLLGYDVKTYYYRVYVKPCVISFAFVLALYFIKESLPVYQPSLLLIIIFSLLIFCLYFTVAWLFMFDDSVKRMIKR